MCGNFEIFSFIYATKFPLKQLKCKYKNLIKTYIFMNNITPNPLKQPNVSLYNEKYSTYSWITLLKLKSVIITFSKAVLKKNFCIFTLEKRI